MNHVDDFDDLGDLYQQLILDHNARPHNFGGMPEATHQADGYNPLCGDQVTVFVQVDGEVLRHVRFSGKGCAISKASASMMTDALCGKRRDEAEAIFNAFHALLTVDPEDSDPAAPGADPIHLGKLAALSGVRQFPIRVKCATLAWHTLRAALSRADAAVSTEIDV